ncbi:MAG TPA: HD domain-containing phosphohydrolase, partial [Acidimicrobiales bacterium]|nr:HD domain-containing phosphohydrolase [Acidimicrobiales bacterium]
MPTSSTKPGKPNAEEWVALQKHPLEGAKLTAPLLPWLGEWALAVEQHHEKFDGRGYPYGLAGDQISYGARIVAVADVFETMTAKRSYKDAISPAAARAELTRCAGTHFDADIVRAFLNISLGRLRWAVGPASLLAQLPFLGQVPFVGGQATGALAGLTSASALGAAALSVGSLVMPHLVAPSSANRAQVASTAKPAEVQLAMVTRTTTSLTPAPGASHGGATNGAKTTVSAVTGGVAAQPAPSQPPSGLSPVLSTSTGTSLPVGVPPTVPASSGTPAALPPVTLAPGTLSPVTLPPVTVPPVTVPSVAPVTVAPVTVPPITIPPVTVP